MKYREFIEVMEEIAPTGAYKDIDNSGPQIYCGIEDVKRVLVCLEINQDVLAEAVSKEELAWIILNFNQKRGYYQLRGEEEEETPDMPMNGGGVVEDFLSQEPTRIVLKENAPQDQVTEEEEEKEEENGILTETLAGIYINKVNFRMQLKLSGRYP